MALGYIIWTSSLSSGLFGLKYKIAKLPNSALYSDQGEFWICLNDAVNREQGVFPVLFNIIS